MKLYRQPKHSKLPTTLTAGFPDFTHGIWLAMLQLIQGPLLFLLLPSGTRDRLQHHDGFPEKASLVRHGSHKVVGQAVQEREQLLHLEQPD